MQKLYLELVNSCMKDFFGHYNSSINENGQNSNLLYMDLSVLSYNSINYLKNRLQYFQLEGTFNSQVVQLQVVVNR